MYNLQQVTDKLDNKWMYHLTMRENCGRHDIAEILLKVALKQQNK
jgi:dTDP-4-dehydrorhamnose reductase